MFELRVYSRKVNTAPSNLELFNFDLCSGHLRVPVPSDSRDASEENARGSVKLTTRIHSLAIYSNVE